MNLKEKCVWGGCVCEIEKEGEREKEGGQETGEKREGWSEGG